jgi:timeless
MKLRENALQQAETLMEYKRAFCHHPSHLGPRSEQGGILSIFMSLLAEPLSRIGNARTDTDHLTIELVLHLFRNLLAADHLVKSSASEQLHHELIGLLDRELVLEILLVLAADIESRENAQYNLLLMELLNHLFRHQDPTTVAAAASTEPGRSQTTSKKTGLLLGQLQRERQVLRANATSRHSHFGGTLVVQKAGGRRQYVSATLMGQPNRADATQPRQRRNRKTEPFVGAASRSSTHRHLEGSRGPAATRAAQALHRFCVRFVETCYGPVMKSLKNEFRRDSVRLEDGDRVVFFQLAWFFCQWWRASGGTRLLEGKETNSSIGHLIFTMDVFTFTLVLNATDTYQQHKKYAMLGHAVALLSEMMHLLFLLYNSDESTEKIMAMGLMDRLFYGSEPLDRLPKLLSRWTPGASTREYLCDLVVITCMNLTLLDSNAEAVTDFAKEGMTKDEKAKHDTVAKMKAAAAGFDVPTYFARKIVSNHTVYMLTQLLSHYSVNSTHVNLRVVELFHRLTQHNITSYGEEKRDADMPKNPLARKDATFEPMLYNVPMLTILNTILNDGSIQKEKDYEEVCDFATTIVLNFATAAKDNPMIFIEALFNHPLPHRFCELATNLYITDELQMLVEKEVLMQNQQKLDQETAALARNDSEDEDLDDDELEFTDVPVSSKHPASHADSSDDDGDDLTEAGVASKKMPTGTKNTGTLDDTDDSDEEAKRLEHMAAKSRQQTQDMLKRLRALDEDSSDDDDNTSGSKKSRDPVVKKAKSIVLSDTEDDED